jgi:hypothetical protein
MNGATTMKVAKKDLRLRVSLALGALALASGMVVACGPDSNSAPPSKVTPGATGCIEDKDNDGYGPGCALGADCDDNDPKNTTQCRACLNNESGCSCATEGKRIKCGKVSSRQGDSVTCSMGAQLCTGGKWSACEPGAWGPGHDGFITTKTLGVPGSAGSCLDCDPNCHLIADTPDGLGDAGADAPFVGEGGTIVYPNTNSNTPTPAEINALSNVDGGFEGGIIKVLVTGQTSATPDPVNVIDPRPAGGDVYFLVDDTGSMGPVAAALRDSIAQKSAQPVPLPCVADPGGGLKAAPGGGIVENLKCKFGTDVFIGMGRYEDYNEYMGAGAPWSKTATTPPLQGPTPTGTIAQSLPYQHILSVQGADFPAQLAAEFFGNTAFNGGPPFGAGLRAGGDVPESLMSALYSAATGDGLLRSGPANFWTVPRENGASGWITPWSASPLANDKVPTNPGSCQGYPCWRPQTTPIFVIMTDAPAHNGPGGQYAYPQYGQTWVTGAAPGPKTNQAPNNALGANPPVAKTFAAANELEYETDGSGPIGLKPRLYWGNVSPNFGNPPSNWPSNSSVSGGINNIVAGSGRTSLRDCAVANNNVTVTTASTTQNAFGNREIPWPDALEYRAPQTLTCSGVSYSNRCGVGAPYSSSANAATYGAAYVGPGTLFNNIRIQVGGNTQVKADGVTPGFESFVVPAIGSRVEFRITMLDDAQVSSPNALLLAGRGNTTDWNVGVTCKNCNGSASGWYTTAANQTIRFAVRTTTPNVIVAVQYWVTPPNNNACAGFVTYSHTSIPQCNTCALGYNLSGAQCCGNDQPVCPGGKVFAQSNNAVGSCPDPGIGIAPQAARTRGAQFVGDCFSCTGFPPSAEANAPQTVRTVGGGNGAGCYVPSCAQTFPWPVGAATTAGGPGWSFQTGGTLAANGSGKCVKAESELTCNAGTAAICNTNRNLCNPSNVGLPTGLLNPPGGVTSNICGCADFDGTPLKPDHPVIPGGAPANGMLTTYFLGGLPNASIWGWGQSTAPGQATPTTRYEALPFTGARPAGVPNDNIQGRSTGRVSTPCTGTYEFALNADDWGKLWVDDKDVVERYDVVGTLYSQDNGPRTFQRTPITRFNMSANTKHNVKIEMAQGGGGYAGQLWWRYVGGTCVTNVLDNNFRQVPSSYLTPDYVTPLAQSGQAQCLTQSSYTATTSSSQTLGDGGWNAESIYKFTVPAGKTFYYHFGLLRNDAAIGTTSTGATVSDTHGNAFLYLKRQADTSLPNNPVVDCNRNSAAFNLSNSGVIAEINGKVTAGTYYLVVDNYANSVVANYNYLLQVNQFEESVTVAKAPTAPTYKETLAKMNSMGAKIIGLENSGASCGEAALAAANFAQFDTRDHLEKIAFDTGSVDQNGLPIVVSLKRNATSCDGLTPPPASLTAKMNEAVNTLANTLRQDLVLRATKAGAAPSPDIDPANAAFVAENFIADVTADSSTTLGRCGNPPTNPGQPATGPDFDPSFTAPNTRQMFNSCLPGAPVRFNVRFKVPGNVQRTAVDQFFRFDLAVAPVGRDALGNKVAGNPLARIPVVIKVPAINAGSAALTRDYDADQACTPGTRPVWSGFGYNSQAPDAIPTKDSKIEFHFSTADTQAGLAPAGGPGEYLFATSTRIGVTPNCAVGLNPRTEVCDRVDLKAAMVAAGLMPNKRWTRIRINLVPSADATNLPTIIDWKMHLSCVPSE